MLITASARIKLLPSAGCKIIIRLSFAMTAGQMEDVGPENGEILNLTKMKSRRKVALSSATQQPFAKLLFYAAVLLETILRTAWAQSKSKI
jgi:hypothetical protein